MLNKTDYKKYKHYTGNNHKKHPEYTDKSSSQRCNRTICLRYFIIFIFCYTISFKITKKYLLVIRIIICYIWTLISSCSFRFGRLIIKFDFLFIYLWKYKLKISCLYNKNSTSSIYWLLIIYNYNFTASVKSNNMVSISYYIHPSAFSTMNFYF